MKLIPYVLSQRYIETSKIDVYKISIFLDKAGKSLWETDSLATKAEIRHEYLEPNGLFDRCINIDEKMNIAWIAIDTKRTKLSDFYNWDEAAARPDKPECWRDFWFFSNGQNEELWSPSYMNHHDAEIQGFGNVKAFFDKIRSLEIRI